MLRRFRLRIVDNLSILSSNLGVAEHRYEMTKSIFLSYSSELSSSAVPGLINVMSNSSGGTVA